tara:strand:+ start:88 stop:330 length:243 start_codon:yes stop_codon:yes gene_type:complete
MPQRVEKYRGLLVQPPVDEIEVNEQPAGLFRTHENTWIVAIVRYLVEPKQAGKIKTNILKNCLHTFKEHPDLVKFPAGNG